MLSAADTITRLGGLARGAHLQTLGFTRRALSRAVKRGEIERVRDGVFASGRIDRQVRAATAHGGALTCASVLQVLGIWVLAPVSVPHVWLGRSRHAHAHDACRCVSHYYRGVPPLGQATVEVALAHFLRCAGDEAFFAAYESALRLGLLTRAAQARVRAMIPAAARWLVDLALPHSDSGLESLLRLRLHVLGIRLECQVSISGVGRVDFVVGSRLILETDGTENHDGASLRHKDLVRDASASALGYETLRFDYAQVIHDWPTVQAAILAALTRLNAHA
ncbi:DUF559 domain-containing protein [Microbacterium sp. UFMG61]|jgi:very-short-patch-repair endonuclease|uniref:DUF559 domain-containing protein n=1 Tax=Microbacterium sp. UFMG61 TaxID=2745935 RepID=UPI0018908C26|nr:DUF559 domain-containing protein [Microbacterium sp. UFMG61]